MEQELRQVSESTGVSPAITIGILTHNYGRYIREAIDSVLAQSRADWELIISDDASTDDTEEIVSPYLADPRITYIRHAANLGQAGNWGFLLTQGTGPIVAVLHADDAWLPETLKTALAAFNLEPELDLFYGNWYRHSEGQPERVLVKQEKGHLFSGHEEFEYQAKCFTCLASAAFLSRTVISATDKPSLNLKMVVDYEYFLRVCVNARKVQASTKALTLYRIHNRSTTAESSSNGVLTQERETLLKMCSLWADRAPLRSGLKAIRFNMAKGTFSDGVTRIVHGDVGRGRRLVWRGLALCPALLTSPKVIIDTMLCLMGKTGSQLLCSLHKARLEGLSEAS